MNTNSKPYFLPYFDGLRGLAALAVFFGHMCCSFYTSLTSGSIDASGVSILPKLVKTPLSIFVASNAAVCIFFVLSGYVMAMLIERSHESFVGVSLRRYLRLAGPAAVSCLISVVLLKLNLYYNDEAAYITKSEWLGRWFTFDGHFHVALKEGLIYIFEKLGSVYNSSLWTLYYELWGSLLIFVLFFVAKNKSLRFIILLLFCSVAIKQEEYGFLCMFAGAISFYFYQMFNLRFTKEWINNLLILVGVFFCSYPEFAPYWHGGPIYNLISSKLSSVWYHSFGAILIVHFMHDSSFFKSFFSNRILLWFGKISFSLYLLHIPIICSLGSVIIYLLDGTLSYNQMVPLAMAAVVVASLFAAHLFSKSVDKYFTEKGHVISRKIDIMFPATSNTINLHSDVKQTYLTSAAKI